MVLGIVLLQLKDHAGARDVLERAIARHGENPYLLANLARAYAAAGDDERAQALIWRALELEPNEETSLNWMIGMAQCQGAGRRAGRVHARGGAAGKLARAAVARALCAGARRSRRGHAAVRRGAGARQPGARGPAHAAERRSRQSRPHRTAGEAHAAALRSRSSTASPWATTCCAPTWSSACSPKRASCSSSSIRSSVRTGAITSSPGSRSSTTRRSVMAK